MSSPNHCPSTSLDSPRNRRPRKTTLEIPANPFNVGRLTRVPGKHLRNRASAALMPHTWESHTWGKATANVSHRPKVNPEYTSGRLQCEHPGKSLFCAQSSNPESLFGPFCSFTAHDLLSKYHVHKSIYTGSFSSSAACCDTLPGITLFTGIAC